MGNGDVVKGFHWSSGRGGLVTPPSPHSLSADSNRPRWRRKRSSSSWGRGRSASRGAVDVDHVDCGAETSTHPSSLGERPYTPSLPDDSPGRQFRPAAKRLGLTTLFVNRVCLRSINIHTSAHVSEKIYMKTRRIKRRFHSSFTLILLHD